MSAISGDRGYVDDFANYLAPQNGGDRPTVVNLAIDGETTGSFVTNMGRLSPVAGRGDQALQLENLNYTSNASSQSTLFANVVGNQNAIGNPVDTITVTLGFNNLAALSSLPTAQALAAAPGVLDACQAQDAGILANIRSLTPDVDLYLLGYYNPFPADPDSPGAPLFNTYGMQLNGIIQNLAGQYGARYVDVAIAFKDREAELTYLDEQPAGFFRSGPFGGLEPIGDVHAICNDRKPDRGRVGRFGAGDLVNDAGLRSGRRLGSPEDAGGGTTHLRSSIGLIGSPSDKSATALRHHRSGPHRCPWRWWCNARPRPDRRRPSRRR